MFAVADTELGRIQALFVNRQDPDKLEFDDLIGLGVTVAAQRMRTAQNVASGYSMMPGSSPEGTRSVAH